ncbi:hypothetical protein HNP69_000508 [Chryseobacterium koreense]|nr:hypothetical protein [Chryseobacterium koreense]
MVNVAEKTLTKMNLMLKFTTYPHFFVDNFDFQEDNLMPKRFDINLFSKKSMVCSDL